MTQEFKPFDRGEALAILAAMMTRTIPREWAVSEAIKTAQTFYKEANRYPETVPFPKVVADRKYGKFAPDDNLLYFVTDDGASVLIGAFSGMRECVSVAIALNSFLPGSNFCSENNSGVEL
jgi:hypothetical protein